MSMQNGQGQFLKYLLVGVSNTLLTMAVILVLTALHTNLYLANACGYLLGIIASFLLNARYTFTQTANRRRFGKFLLTCAVCYLLNLGVMRAYLLFDDNAYLCQLCGMGCYTVAGFILNKYWAMT
jgi:gtrA-like protein